MEKAFAKMNINYSQLDAGDSRTSLMHLTNMPVFGHDPRTMTDEEIAKTINDADKKGYPMVTGVAVPHASL